MSQRSISRKAARRARKLAEYQAALEEQRALESGEIKAEFLSYIEKLPNEHPFFRSNALPALKQAAAVGEHYPMIERLLRILPVGEGKDLNGDGRVSWWERLVYMGISLVISSIGIVVGVLV
jgi:hypothetical protein